MKKELDERGQSIILVAIAMVVLLVFVGMAVDVGLLYGRRIQLQRAVDAAALAAVVELPDEVAVQTRAEQFVRLNGFDPCEANVVAVPGHTVGIGTSNFLTVTAQLPMETMFLRFVGRATVQVSASAVAEYKSPMEIYASQHPESGVTGMVNLSVFGRDSNPQWGDAFMATRWTGGGSCSGVTPTPNPYWSELNGAYPFRIYVPANYVTRMATGEIQVEILDPDCYNNPQNTFDIPYVVTPTVERLTSLRTDRESVAVIESGDENNPVWQVRMDQYLPFCFGSGQSMMTRYTLYYYKQGDLVKYKIATYEKGLDSDTDLKWIVPDGFRFDLGDYPDMAMDEVGNRSFYIDVEGLEGTYGNGFDLWAGPPPTLTIPANVNERNVYLLRKMFFGGGNSHDSGGVAIFAIGYLPLNVNTKTAFTVTLGYVPLNAAGKRVRVSSWDMDRWEEGSPCFCLATGHSCLGLSLDYYLEGVPGFHDVGTVSCSTEWSSDILTLPIEFYGGYLYAIYHTNAQDTTDWKMEYLDVMDDSYVRLVK